MAIFNKEAESKLTKEVDKLMDEARKTGKKREMDEAQRIIHADVWWAYQTIVTQSFFLVSYEDVMTKIQKLIAGDNSELSTKIKELIAKESAQAMSERYLY